MLEKELLSIIDTLKTFENILRGNKINVQTNALNLLGKNNCLLEWLMVTPDVGIWHRSMIFTWGG